jgi:hypothetical protein
MDSILKVNFDGSHNLASLLYLKPNNDENLLSSYISERSYKNGYNPKNNQKITNPSVDLFNILFDMALKLNITSKDKQFTYLKEMFITNSLDLELENLDDFINYNLDRKYKNYYVRKNRSKLKAFNNPFNYFVTITCDSSKQSEASFIKKLKRKLNNYHTLYNWTYMGVFERSPKGRIHFHALMNVPNDINLNLELKKDFNKKTKTMKEYYQDKKLFLIFGRNDFRAMVKEDLYNGNTLEYVTKYINKTNTKILYSRGLKSFTFYKVDPLNNIKSFVVCSFDKNEFKYILYSDFNYHQNKVNLRL